MHLIIQLDIELYRGHNDAMFKKKIQAMSGKKPTLQLFCQERKHIIFH